MGAMQHPDKAAYDCQDKNRRNKLETEPDSGSNPLMAPHAKADLTKPSDPVMDPLS